MLKKIIYSLLLIGFSKGIHSQCATTQTLSSANNMLGLVRNSSNPVAVDKDLNTIVFLHRHLTSQFGGNSGNLRYDISTNAGSTWTSNIGVLNPASGVNQARYPNVTLYNPAANTNTANAYLGYLAATTNTQTSTWSFINTGGRMLNGTGNSENYNQPNVPSNLIAGSLTKGGPGVFWATDEATSDGVNGNGTIQVFKGVWSSVSNSINWSLNISITPPYNPNSSFINPRGESAIGFDPTGTFGWLAFMGDISTNFNDAFQPIFYKTVNGGATWTGPIMVNLSTMPCLANNAFTPAADTECNLVVDLYGNPHLLGVFGDANVGSIDYFNWHAAMDITYNGVNWLAYEVSNVKGGEAIVTSNPNNIMHEARPQISRSADGKKIFFTWTDNATYLLGDANDSPNLFGKAFDVQLLKWTPVKDFTSCNASTAGKIFYPHIAKEVLEPNSTTYKIAAFYGEFTSVLNADVPVNYRFLDNVTFSASEFSIAVSSSLSLNVLPSNNPLLCPGNNLSLQLVGSYNSVLWSNGSVINSAVVNTPGIYTVTASSGCSSGTSTINVTALSFTPSITSTSICSGSSLNLSIAGNAYGYTWTPGGVGNSITVNPTVTTNYNIQAAGDACVLNSNVNVSVLPAPNLVVISNKVLTCAGEEIIIQAIGPSILVWNTSAVSSSISVSPTVTSNYSVTGTDSNGCSTTKGITQLVNTCTNIKSNQDQNEMIVVYPNPNNGVFEMTSSVDMNYTITNALGQTVGSYSIKSNNGLPISHELSPGLYFIKGKTLSGSEFSKKVIVNK